MSRAPDTLEPARHWSGRAACLGCDLEIFYPGSGDMAAVKYAKAICAGCPVKAECGQEALDRRDPYGIWGGLSSNDRERLLRNGARRCENCGARYVPRGNQQRYCSKNCQSVGYQRSQAGYEKRRGAA